MVFTLSQSQVNLSPNTKLTSMEPTKNTLSLSLSLTLIVNFNICKTKLLSFYHPRELFLPAISVADAKLLESISLQLLVLMFSIDWN